MPKLLTQKINISLGETRLKLQLMRLPPSFFAVDWAWSNFLSVTITVAPSWANRIAQALPMPPPAPAIIAKFWKQTLLSMYWTIFCFLLINFNGRYQDLPVTSANFPSNKVEDMLERITNSYWNKKYSLQKNTKKIIQPKGTEVVLINL